MNKHTVDNPWIAEEKCIPYIVTGDYVLSFYTQNDFLLRYITADKSNDNDNNNEFFTLSIDGINQIQRPLGVFVPFLKLESELILLPSQVLNFFILNGIGEHKIYLCGTEYRKEIK